MCQVKNRDAHSCFWFDFIEMIDYTLFDFAFIVNLNERKNRTGVYVKVVFLHKKFYDGLCGYMMFL